MKKTIKRLGVLLLLGVMVFALCGCRALDEMRARQIFPEEDGSFIINDVRYVKLETNDYFWPTTEYDGDYYLTDPDVPVLLSAQFKKGELSVTADRRFCRDLWQDQWYCREDIFEEMQAKNREPFVPDTLFYSYYGYDENKEWTELNYKLSLEEVAAIAEVLKGEPMELGDGVYISTDWECGLTEATDDLLFRYSGPSIAKAGETFYLSTYSYTDGRATTYQVPEALNAIFTKITQKYLQEFYPDMIGEPSEPMEVTMETVAF